MAWLLTYEREDRNGPYAEQAAGRVLELIADLPAHPERRSRATAYLTRFPEGAHVQVAEKLLRQ